MKACSVNHLWLHETILNVIMFVGERTSHGPHFNMSKNQWMSTKRCGNLETLSKQANQAVTEANSRIGCLKLHPEVSIGAILWVLQSNK